MWTWAAILACALQPPGTESPAQERTRAFQPGLVWVFFNDVGMRRPADMGIDPQVALDTGTTIRDYARIWLGWIKAPEAGPVTFLAEADNGLRLWLGDNLALDGWSAPTREGTFVFTRQDELVSFRLAFHQDGGTAHVRLRWRWRDRPAELVPASAFCHTEQDRDRGRQMREGKMPIEEVVRMETKAVIYAAGGNVAASGPIRLGRGPHLFLDDLLIDSSANLARKVNCPPRDSSIPNPVVTGKEDGCFQPFMTILRDSQTRRFRVWYGCRRADFSQSASHLGYMESEDGVHWIRPHRVLEDPAPIQFGASVIDEGAGCPDPARRFKYGWWKDGGLKVAASPDGIHWTPLAPGVVLHHNHDINGIFRDPLRRRYVATLSSFDTGPTWSGKRRVTLQAHSQDLLTWTTPHYVLTPHDGLDQGQTQFYAMDGFLVRGGLTIGLVKVLRDDLKADDPPDPPNQYGIGYTTLAWTRDGETWVRDREPFFDRDPKRGAWDHAHAWIDEQVLVGDEVYLYYGGYARGHKVNRFEERQIGLLKMARDRYVAREAGDTPGHLTTPLVMLDADSLALNVDSKAGEVKVEILDEGGQPMPGFSAADCRPITTDSLAAPVAWKRSLRLLAATPIRLRFSLRTARLFALELR